MEVHPILVILLYRVLLQGTETRPVTQRGPWIAAHAGIQRLSLLYILLRPLSSPSCSLPTKSDASYKSLYGRPQPLHVPTSPSCPHTFFLNSLSSSTILLHLHHNLRPFFPLFVPSPRNPTTSTITNMCTPKVKTYHGTDLFPIAQINGRPVLQPACNRVMTLERCNSLKKKSLPKSPPPTKSTSTAITSFSAPNSPKSKTPKPALKLVDDLNRLNSSTDKNVVTPKSTPPRLASIAITKSKKCSGGSSASWEGITSSDHTSSLGGSYSSSLIVEAPGSIAVARREQVNLMQAQRKMRIAHYGRTPSKIEGKVFPIDSSTAANPQEKRCSFITPNSDPRYVAYHDEEWGVPVHDDRMLFELLVLTGAQVGLDWTSILRKRDEFRAAFSGFEIDVVANFNQRQIASISAEYGLDSSRVRGAVDNANCILEIRREFGSFDKYLWGFVNHKPFSTNYKSFRKIPVKTSRSETMSKDMVRRGFRYVGPTVMHSFMQASGLTNDHLITCPRHLQCNAGAH